jgi:uncharacterized protein (TIGR02996 family)
MTDAAALVQAILSANPLDRFPRLVFADWLEEQGDERGEFIRVCEQMRTLPPYSEEYWKLKADRKARQAKLRPKWVAMLGYDGSDYDYLFRAGIPRDTLSQWRLVREVAERWHRRPLGDLPTFATRPSTFEPSLGRNLPEGIALWAEMEHELDPYYWRNLGGFVDQPSIRAVALGGEAGGRTPWVVRDQDWHLPHPPIYKAFDLADRGSGLPAQPFAESPAEFALVWTLTRLPEYRRDVSVIPSEAQNNLSRTYPITASWGRLRIFEGYGAIALMMPAGLDDSRRTVIHYRF